MTNEGQRERMVEWDLAGRGIADPRVLAAFTKVPREAFVAHDMLDLAYDDAALPIGEGQTISQPYIVALTVEALLLQGHERVLEIGTGWGYAAAILGEIANEVLTIERHASLAVSACERLARLGLDNVHVRCSDGTLGWPEHAPYDAIAVAAGGPEVPEALQSQLAIGGRLVIPVGTVATSQSLVRITRASETEYEEEHLASVRFVPLIGAQGWSDASRIEPANRREPRRIGSGRR